MSPIPGHENTLSVMTAPPTSAGSEADDRDDRDQRVPERVRATTVMCGRPFDSAVVT